MNDEDIQHYQQLLTTRMRRAQLLELQIAQRGITADPSLLMELEDIRAQIEIHRAKLGDLVYSTDCLNLICHLRQIFEDWYNNFVIALTELQQNEESSELITFKYKNSRRHIQHAQASIIILREYEHYHEFTKLAETMFDLLTEPAVLQLDSGPPDIFGMLDVTCRMDRHMIGDMPKLQRALTGITNYTYKQEFATRKK